MFFLKKLFSMEELFLKFNRTRKYNLNSKYFLTKQFVNKTTKNWELKKEDFKFIISNPCIFCGFKFYNNIVKISNGSYNNKTVKSCCIICFKLKGNKDPKSFINNTRCIFNKTKANSYNSIIKYCKNWKISFEISEQEYIFFVTKKICDLCNNNTDFTELNRIDITKGYTVDNCMSVCCNCKSMYSYLPNVSLFKEKLNIIKNCKEQFDCDHFPWYNLNKC